MCVVVYVLPRSLSVNTHPYNQLRCARASSSLKERARERERQFQPLRSVYLCVCVTISWRPRNRLNTREHAMISDRN